MADKADRFSQTAYMVVTEDAANTLTFAGLSVFSNILSQSGMILHRVSYMINAAAFALMNSTGDTLKFGLSGSNSIDSAQLDDPEIYDQRRIIRIDVGTAAQGTFQKQPITVDFSGLPGGGKLVPADRIYLYAEGEGLSGASTLSARVDFTIIELAAADYLELAQSMRVLK